MTLKVKKSVAKVKKSVSEIESTKPKPLPKAKFTLDDLIYRKRKIPITADVVIDDEVYTDYKIGWVEVRGQQDPESLGLVTKYIEEYKDSISDIEDEFEDGSEEKDKATADATSRFMAAAVAVCITRWDNKLFNNRKFDLEECIKLFSEQKNFKIYNQISLALQESSDFLPKSSQQQ